MDSLIRVLTALNIAVVAFGSIYAVGFPWHYRKSPWRDSEVGRALMTKGRAVAALFVSSLAIIALSWLLPVWLILAVQLVVNGYVVIGVRRHYRVMREAQRNPDPGGDMSDLRF